MFRRAIEEGDMYVVETELSVAADVAVTAYEAVRHGGLKSTCVVDFLAGSTEEGFEWNNADFGVMMHDGVDVSRVAEMLEDLRQSSREKVRFLEREVLRLREENQQLRATNATLMDFKLAHLQKTRGAGLHALKSKNDTVRQYCEDLTAASKTWKGVPDTLPPFGNGTLIVYTIICH